MSEPLGQNLFRTALESSSLAIFNETAAVMGRSDVPLHCQNDAFTAIRFGLAGIVLRAWEPTITEPANPFTIDNHVIGYRFRSDPFFPASDKTVVDRRRSPTIYPAVTETQGGYALKIVKEGLQQSMKGVIENADEHGIRGIAVSDVLAATQKYVLAAKQHGLTDIPDIYFNRAAVYEDFYQVRTSETPDLDSFPIAARNPVRFTSEPIRFLMRSHAHNRVVTAPTGIHDIETIANKKYDLEIIGSMLYDITRHAIRSSQRNDMNLTVVSAERLIPGFTLGTNKQGRPEVQWPDKHHRPIRRLPEGETPPLVGIVSNRRRNKCPIGYTEAATDVMPLRRIYDSIITYLVDNDAADPVDYMSPKSINSSLAEVR